MYSITRNGVGSKKSNCRNHSNLLELSISYRCPESVRQVERSYAVRQEMSDGDHATDYSYVNENIESDNGMDTHPMLDQAAALE